MSRFQLRLADLVIRVSALYDATARFCRDYLTDGTADFSVEIIPGDIDFEREMSAQNDRTAGVPVRRFSEEYLETLAVYRKIAERLPEYDALLFHGSAIAVDGVGYLFTAKSGTGKSTHTRLWRERFGSRAVMVNDDKPLLRLTDGGVTVYGTPWDGKHRLSANISVPLKAVILLERDTENHIEPVSFREAYPMLLRQTYRPVNDPAGTARTLALADRLGHSVELYRLGCNMEPEAALAAYNGMNRRERL